MDITQAIRIIDNLVSELGTDACEVAMEYICDYIKEVQKTSHNKQSTQFLKCDECEDIAENHLCDHCLDMRE